MYINPKSFYQWWDVFHSGDANVTEIRLLGKVRGRKVTYSGYFTDPNTALKALQDFPHELGAYSPFNKVHESCLGRDQFNKIIEADKTTSGADIEGRLWIMIDLDPRRSSDTNSTDAEKKLAYNKMRDIGVFLRDQGFSSPVVADSGNGYHLYYRVNLSADKNDNTVKKFLEVMDMLFSDGKVDIDLEVSDANRISKIIGSVSCKGTKENKSRPQRESRFVQTPEIIDVTPKALIEKVIAMMPHPEKPSRYNGYSTEVFDIDAFLQKHNIEVTSISNWQGGKKYLLKECPFDSNHKAPDSAIFVCNSGAIGFKCLHNSCASYTWRDVRLHYDPDAYSQRDRMLFERKRDYYSTAERPAPVVIEENSEKGPKWFNLADIEWQDPSKLVYIPTGLTDIDKNIGGLALGDVSIISGLAGAGKSTMLNIFLLNAIQHGYKASIWSGELMSSRFKSWFNQAACGANLVRPGQTPSGQDYYYCPKDVADKIDEWTKGKIFLYNNNYGNHSSQILKDIRDSVKDKGTQLVILDNKMSMKLDSYEGDKNEREAGLINELADFAKMSQIHIILVCHPRKEISNALLRMESIAGNSDLYNCASNVFLCHRVGTDFQRRATEFFGTNFVQDVTAMDYNEVVEIAKNRSHGRTDVIAKLYFEPKTRRYINEKNEHTIYGWQDNPIQTIIPLESVPVVPKKVEMLSSVTPTGDFDNDDDDIPF